MVSKGHLLKYMEGDNQALSVGFEQELPKLIFYAYSFVKDKEAAADIVSGFFERLLFYSIEERNDKLSKDPIHFKRLVYVIIKNKCLDHIKVESNRRKIELENITPINEKNNSEELFVAEAFEKLSEQLGERQNEVLQLYVNGYSSKEIANQLKISVNTVQNTLATSKEKVLTLWKDFFEN